MPKISYCFNLSDSPVSFSAYKSHISHTIDTYFSTVYFSQIILPLPFSVNMDFYYSWALPCIPHIYLSVEWAVTNIIYSRKIYMEFIICQNCAELLIINVYYKNQCVEKNNFGELCYKATDEKYIFFSDVTYCLKGTITGDKSWKRRNIACLDERRCGSETVKKISSRGSRISNSLKRFCRDRLQR